MKNRYTAPEVINGEDYSYACDIWSLGCTLIEMLTGIFLFFLFAFSLSFSLFFSFSLSLSYLSLTSPPCTPLGKPPFYHLNAVQTLQTMVEEEPPLPPGLSPDCSDFLSSIFTRDWKDV